jgi:murein DD-endopeptidase MepM/ murein hydrolase activator NlpD
MSKNATTETGRKAKIGPGFVRLGAGIAVAVALSGAAAASIFGGGLFGSAGKERARAAEVAERKLSAAEHRAFTDIMATRQERVIEVEQGETLALLLGRAGFSWRDINAAMAAVGDVFNPRKVRPGQAITVYFDSKDGAARLTGLAFRANPGANVTVSRLFDGAYAAREIQLPLTFEVAHVAAVVDGSLYESALAGGATDKEMEAFSDIFAYDVDFQRDIFPGDPFEMVFERFHDDEGRTVKTGEMLYAALTAREGLRAFYRFKAPGSDAYEWYDSLGKTARKFLMKTPINGARLSSGFGMRSHPILGFSKMHAGVDFAAPTGTPIMAAGDGVVGIAGFNGGYGRYIRLRHEGGYDTAYAHMSAFGKGIRPGVRVRQGQIIGYVGSSGLSTGPHLHYEVLLKGRQINPMSMRVPTGRNLEGPALALFQKERQRIDALRQARGGAEKALIAQTSTTGGGGVAGAGGL